MKKSKQLLSYIAILLGIFGFLSLYFSLITTVVSTEGTTRLGGIDLIVNLFNGAYNANAFYIFLFVAFSLYILFQLAFIILACFKIFKAKLNSRVLQVVSVCMMSFAVLTLSAVICICNKYSVVTDTIYSNILHIGLGTYLLFIASIVQLTVSFVPQTFESTKK